MRTPEEEAIAYDKGVNFAREALKKENEMSEHSSYWEHHKEELRGKDTSGIEIDPPTESPFPDRQDIWRTYSETANSGFFVWDVRLVMGEPYKESYFTKCRDGSFIMEGCFHFWTKEKALKHLLENLFSDNLHIISGLSELTRQEYKEYLAIED